jgi:diaminopimelate decarboxylase
MPTTIKEAYSSPRIESQSIREMNTFAGQPGGAGSFPELEGFSVSDLVEKYGSPLYVASESAMRNKIRSFRQAFVSRYPDTTIAWSYKTNYLGGICSIMHEEGAWAEVVSGFEYRLAEDLNIPGNRIIFNGPYKPLADLERAAKAESIVHLDNFDELGDMESVATSLGKKVRVGIRVNLQLNDPPWTKFGFGIESGEAMEACRKIQESDHLELGGFHIHVGTFILDPGLYRRAIDGLIGLANAVREQWGTDVEYFDLGGGFASANTLHGFLLQGEAVSPTPDQYAEAICTPLLEKISGWKKKPRLILEPGRILVDEAMSMITTVVATKRLSDGKKAVVVDAGVNVLPTTYWYRHEIACPEETGASVENVNILGPLCMNIDVIRQDIRLPALRRGSLLLVRNVGAYNITQSMQFIYERPATILIHGGKIDLLRVRETADHIRALDRIPAHLARDGKGTL